METHIPNAISITCQADYRTVHPNRGSHEDIFVNNLPHSFVDGMWFGTSNTYDYPVLVYRFVKIFQKYDS